MSMTTELPVQMDLANGTSYQLPVKPLVSDALVAIFLVVNDFAITCVISLLGVFTNIANIIVYCKMGFSESSNVNFLVLSVFDLLVSLIVMISRTMFTPFVQSLSTGVMTTYIARLLALAMVVVVSGAAMMTALISVERCVCVIFPLKVKTLLTRRRKTYLMLAVVAYHVIFVFLLYIENGSSRLYPKKIDFYFFSMYTVPLTTCYFIVVITTFYLVIRLKSNQEWRRQTATQSEKSSDKDNKLVRTIIAVSALFIVCSFPSVGIFIGKMLYPPFHYSNPYLRGLITVVYTFSGVFQSVSSSVNIFFYYNMSSKFKKVFSECFCLGSKGNPDNKASG